MFFKCATWMILPLSRQQENHATTNRKEDNFMPGKKDIKLRAFDIGNTSVSKEYSDLFSRLHERLNSSVNVNDRRMSLNNSSDSNGEQDIISYFNKTAKTDTPMLCTMLRVALGDNVQHISSELFNKETFTLKDLEETQISAEAIYKRHFHFIAFKNHLVTTLPGNITIKGLQTYLNWYLEDLYEINPKIDDQKISELADIQNIRVVDPVQATSKSSVAGSTESVSGVTKTLRNLSRELINKFLHDAPSLEKEQLDQMISAELVLKFRKPKDSDPEALKKAYSALLKPVSDIENYQIKRRNSSTIYSGKDILESKTVTIETLSDGAINEQQLEQEMRKYILELEGHV